MPSPSVSKVITLAQAERRLAKFLERARATPALARRLKLDRKIPWQAEVQLVSGPVMKKLNAQYRGKDYATDVLSFPAPAPFLKQGQLGELVICRSVLARQAREQGHSVSNELDVLLAHGLLHLLGWDHERSSREASAQARLEQRLLTGRKPGLILRSHTVK
jgi:probable rRNA maturation factor